MHKEVKQGEKGRYYIISDHSRRRDKKFYLKHYPRKRLLAMHDFTPKEKEMREDIKNVKIAKYKALLFAIYQEKRDDRKREEEDGWIGYESDSD